jgi:hypothetical protein
MKFIAWSCQYIGKTLKQCASTQVQILDTIQIVMSNPVQIK